VAATGDAGASAATGQRSTAAVLAATVAVVAWGFGPLLVNGISASATTVVFWRMLAAQPVMIAIAYLTGGRMSLAMLRRAFVTGVCFAGTMVLGFQSFRETSIVNATLIPALQPALVLLVARRLFGERRTRVELGLAALALGGAVIVVLGASSEGSSRFGDLLAVGSLVVFTAYFLLSKHHRNQDVHSWAWIASVFVVAFVCVAPWCLATSDDIGSMAGTDWLWLVLLVLGPGVVGHGLMTWAHAHLDVTFTSLLALGNPVISTVGAWIIFGQSLVPSQLAGAALVLVALAAIVRRQRGDRAELARGAEAAATQDLLDT
jgi:drug/metabolite transporter (DMT)-like permease